MTWLVRFGSLWFLLTSVMIIPVFLSGQGDVFRHLADDEVTGAPGPWALQIAWLKVIVCVAWCLASAGASLLLKLDRHYDRLNYIPPLSATDLRVELLRFKMLCDEADAARLRAKEEEKEVPPCSTSP